VTEILGHDGVTGVALRHVETGARTEILCSGLFVYIGVDPNTACVAADVSRDAAGHIVVDERGATSVPNLWAIGAVRSAFAGTLADAIADAERAADEIARRHS